MNPDSTQKPDRLPPRDLPRRRSGRHRNPLSFDSWVGTPTLVLAIPGTADPGGYGQQVVDLVRAYRPEVAIRFGYTEGDEHPLTEALAGLETGEGRGIRAVVVPLVSASHPATLHAINTTVSATGVSARVTEGLGPHPMLAEVLHLRLAEGGFVRADRMRLISVVAATGSMADGVVVGSVGGADAVSSAGVTAVLLAARLGITVLPVDLEDQAHLDEVFGQMRSAGSVRTVLAPSIIGTEYPMSAVEDVARRYGARVCAPLGAHSTLAKIAALRYAEVLNALGIEQPPTLDELPAPVGSRHRPES
ncbi:sirohydrochlorin chelatase [Marinitenerispora sediminis]|uniref:Cobalamin biosynthesis protein CbiX n=1 Tax=Marinitenerispora sediminis TaxID=1931232 RepID=A0A368T085_9ACTN|nr:cobalamin biosynthesis protein CbiX [Marinitenerispora sediminis]RCV49932.1 cobalamin biosynthesis protein CbiX [Marinitenerispora sediminis]RCV52412.1 cobalamin biosynthesis protein CbiX [Marinitenerispora sediminis]RCV53036.1 cobalamin biosynthesis protein CbiX [Marinitenerispora sediminis]